MTTESPRGPVETIRTAMAPGLSRVDDAWLTSRGGVVVPVGEIEAGCGTPARVDEVFCGDVSGAFDAFDRHVAQMAAGSRHLPALTAERRARSEGQR